MKRVGGLDCSTQWRIAGNWEPRIFLKRRGDDGVDALWPRIHSDEAIARLKSLGINLCHIHFHKGYGLQHEAGSIEEAAEFADRLHKAGIRVGAYIGSTFFPETFRHEQREAMYVVNGRTGWSQTQYFRHHWCFTSPAARRYFEQVIELAIEKLAADVLHFDNAFNFTHDRACHCRSCLEAFAEALRGPLYPLVQAAGYDDASHLSPPPIERPGLTATTRLSEPGAIAWALFQADSGHDALKHFADYARNLDPNIGILFNGATLCGIHPFCRTDRELDKLRLVDFTCVEDAAENPPGVSGEGRVISRFRPYKAGVASRTSVCCYTTEKGRPGDLLLAESAVFNHNCLGFVETAMQSNHRVTTDAEHAMLEYLLRNEEMFVDREPLWQVAMLRHQRSQMLNPFPGGLSPYVIEQVLFERHRPFGLISEAALLDPRILRQFDILVVADVPSVREDELEAIARFIEQGGRLLSLGTNAIRDEFNQLRSVWGFHRFFGDSVVFDTGAYEQTPNEPVSRVMHESLATCRTLVTGDGSAAHLNQIEHVLPIDSGSTFDGFPWYHSRFWNAPKNVESILDHLSKLMEGRWQWEIGLPRSIGVETWRGPAGPRFQMVNYSDDPYAGNGSLFLPSNAERQVQPFADWHAPEGQRRLTGTLQGDGVLFEVPPFSRLATLDISLNNL